MVGASLTGPKFITNVSRSFNSPSETTTVIKAGPYQSKVVLIVNVESSELASTITSAVSENASTIKTSPVSMSVSSKS